MPNVEELKQLDYDDFCRAIRAFDMPTIRRLSDDYLFVVQTIERQLGDKNWLDPNGERMSEADWNSWRRKAKRAWQEMRNRRSFLLREIGDRIEAAKIRLRGVELDGVDGLLQRLFRMVCSRAEDLIPFTEEEQAVLGLVKDHLDERKEEKVRDSSVE